VPFWQWHFADSGGRVEPGHQACTLRQNVDANFFRSKERMQVPASDLVGSVRGRRPRSAQALYTLPPSILPSVRQLEPPRSAQALDTLPPSILPSVRQLEPPRLLKKQTGASAYFASASVAASAAAAAAADASWAATAEKEKDLIIKKLEVELQMKDVIIKEHNAHVECLQTFSRQLFNQRSQPELPSAAAEKEHDQIHKKMEAKLQIKDVIIKALEARIKCMRRDARLVLKALQPELPSGAPRPQAPGDGPAFSPSTTRVPLERERERDREIQRLLSQPLSDSDSPDSSDVDSPLRRI